VAGEDKQELVALRDRRDAVIDALSTHFTSDVLALDEFERRVNLAHRAGSLSELDELLSDLEPAAAKGTSRAMVPKAEASRTAIAARESGTRRVLMILSSTRRKGTWRVPRKLPVVTVLGGVDLDFREAELAPGVTEIKVTNVLGGVAIIVPPDLAVECEGAAVLSTFEGLEQRAAEPDPDAPLLRISGVAILGSVEISTRQVGEPMKADETADIGEIGQRRLPPGEG